MRALRYLLYLAFAFAALIFWPLFTFGVLGWPLGDPACTFQPGGCPPPTIWRQLSWLAVFFGAIPATVLLFVFYRRVVRRWFGLDDDS